VAVFTLASVIVCLQSIPETLAINDPAKGIQSNEKQKGRPKAVSIAFARKILGSSENLVGVGKQEPKPEPDHGNHDA
jgi:hypothetical protein